MKTRVGILGAGVSGLAHLKVLLESPGEFAVTCYEMTDRFGGEWNYTENTEIVDDRRPSAIYTYLRTNSCLPNNHLPGLEMSRGDFWSTHAEVMEYIREYVRRFDLEMHIQFNTKVTQVTRLSQDGGTDLWRVRTETNDGEKREKLFDVVVMGTGTQKRANIPKVKGEEIFCGDVIHSCQYRRPQVYKDKVVLVVGAFTSGQDITDQVAKFAHKVYVNVTIPIVAPPNVEIVGCKYMSHFTESGVVMENGRELEVDSVILCTGYKLEYPSLDASCGVEVNEGLLYPVYKSFVNARHPSMFFPGLHRISPVLRMCGMTAEVARNILLGKAVLPSSVDMVADVDGEIQKYQDAGRPLKTIPFLFYLDGSFRVVQELARLGKIPYPTEGMALHRATVTYCRAGQSNETRSYLWRVGHDGKVTKEELPAGERDLWAPEVETSPRG